MSWRNVIISSRCKLDYKMGYLVIRGEDVKRVFLDEVAMILLENPVGKASFHAMIHRWIFQNTRILWIALFLLM